MCIYNIVMYICKGSFATVSSAQKAMEKQYKERDGNSGSTLKGACKGNRDNDNVNGHSYTFINRSQGTRC